MISRFTLASFPRLSPLLLDTNFCVTKVDGPQIVAVPGAHSGVVGAITYGTRQTAVLDVARLLPAVLHTAQPAPRRKTTSVLITRARGYTCGLLITEAEIQSMPLTDPATWPLADATEETGFLRVPPADSLAPGIPWLDLGQIFETLGAAQPL